MSDPVLITLITAIASCIAAVLSAVVAIRNHTALVEVRNGLKAQSFHDGAAAGGRPDQRKEVHK